VDAHCHVFGPADKFPYSPDRKYTPVDAPKEKLFALRDYLGFDKNIIVQASCHGKDNAALIDALENADGKARGIAVIGEEVSDAELVALDLAGVRGVRFNFVKRLVDFTPRDVLKNIVVYFEMEDLPELEAFFTSLPTTIVVDHMGRPNVKKGLDHPEFLCFTDMLEKHENIWTKVSCPERLTLSGAPYDDVVPFARMLVESYRDRVLWGSDWPHPNMVVEAPDDGLLVDVIPKIAVTAELQEALLVDNPMRLYWPEQAGA
jgi:2-pyrone-4,6-dicarboxylate lactonase